MTLLTLDKAVSTKTDTRETDRVPPQPGPLQREVRATAAEELTHLLFDQQDRARIHDTWRTLVGGEAFAYRPGLSPDERTALSYDRLRLVNDAVDNPEALASDPRLLASLHEWTGFVDGALGTLSGIHYNLFLGSFVDHDDRRHDLSEYMSMNRTGTFLCTELDHGNDAAAMETTATLDPATGGFVLDTPHPGAQKFMPNTSLVGGPKSALVAARLLVEGEDQGVFLFLVPLSDERGHLPGITVRALPPKLGSNVDHCLTSFDQVWLPREALLEAEHGRLSPDNTVTSGVGNRRKRFLRSIARVTTGKLCMSAAAIGVSRTALAIAVRHAHHRHISGPKAGQRLPLAAHRSHHGRLLRALATGYAMTFLHRRVVTRWAEHTPADQAEVERLVAIAKGWITWQARDITLECRERCGAQGLFRVNGLTELQQDLEGAITAEGDNLVVWLKAGGEMLFGHEPVERGHLGPLSPDQELADLEFLRGLLAEAESIWQARARTALREGPAGDPVGRWNEASTAALEVVSAHARLQAADAFLATAAQATQPTARFLLHSLCRLFLLKQISEHTGDLLAEGLISPDHVRGLPRTVETVVSDLAPHMTTLVDAFTLPDEYLATIPIASGTSITQHLYDRPSLVTT
ncbi:acyl-CoA dehydrogenase [Streptomyces tailanensis]|uniref:acyl-CoA dehydrogenase family protein n=1 Tax=Streptomyces tailanensis TaxID=2569858 RepID=UPI00122E49CD|nr:acyl-CoA dehydrogenase [Streptomyces tailanensis]